MRRRCSGCGDQPGGLDESTEAFQLAQEIRGADAAGDETAPRTGVEEYRCRPISRQAPHDIIKRNVWSTPSSQGSCAATTQLAQMYSTSLRKPCDFKLFRLHLPVARKSLRWVRAIVLDPFAQHALMDIQIAGCLRYAEAAFTHLLHRLKLVIATEFPLLHSIAPVSWQTL